MDLFEEDDLTAAESWATFLECPGELPGLGYGELLGLGQG